MEQTINDIFETIIEDNLGYTAMGRVASYIPELTKSSPQNLGVCLIDLNGNMYEAGDYNKKFTIQSISKVLSLMLALMDNGETYVFEKVGMEPTGDSFNSIVNLELKSLHKPFNPMINAGAIATTSMIAGASPEERMGRIIDLACKLSDNPNIGINESVYLSEKATGNRNRSLAYFMKSYNVIEGDVEEVLDMYFRHCSIEMDCRDIARIGSVLANDGISVLSGERIVSKHICRIVKTLMVTCGLYDASGEFAVHIGIPAKSGVGGGIMAAVPHRMGIGVYGPALDEKGNSVAGIQVLRELSEKLDLNIF